MKDAEYGPQAQLLDSQEKRLMQLEYEVATLEYHGKRAKYLNEILARQRQLNAALIEEMEMQELHIKKLTRHLARIAVKGETIWKEDHLECSVWIDGEVLMAHFDLDAMLTYQFEELRAHIHKARDERYDAKHPIITT